jgi:hypothetical protein
MAMTERRERVLSDLDIEAISDAVAGKMPICALGIDPEDATIIKDHIRMWKRGRDIIGNCFMYAIAAMLLAIVGTGLFISIRKWLQI